MPVTTRKQKKQAEEKARMEETQKYIEKLKSEVMQDFYNPHSEINEWYRKVLNK